MHKVNTSDNGGRNLECFNNSALMEISYRQKNKYGNFGFK